MARIRYGAVLQLDITRPASALNHGLRGAWVEGRIATGLRRYALDKNPVMILFGESASATTVNRIVRPSPGDGLFIHGQPAAPRPKRRERTGRLMVFSMRHPEKSDRRQGGFRLGFSFGEDDTFPSRAVPCAAGLELSPRVAGRNRAAVEWFQSWQPDNQPLTALCSVAQRNPGWVGNTYHFALFLESLPLLTEDLSRGCLCYAVSGGPLAARDRSAPFKVSARDYELDCLYRRRVVHAGLAFLHRAGYLSDRLAHETQLQFTGFPLYCSRQAQRVIPEIFRRLIPEDLAFDDELQALLSTTAERSDHEIVAAAKRLEVYLSESRGSAEGLRDR